MHLQTKIENVKKLTFSNAARFHPFCNYVTNLLHKCIFCHKKLTRKWKNMNPPTATTWSSPRTFTLSAHITLFVPYFFISNSADDKQSYTNRNNEYIGTGRQGDTFHFFDWFLGQKSIKVILLFLTVNNRNFENKK